MKFHFRAKAKQAMVPFAKYLIEKKSIVKTIFQITLVPLCQNLLPIPAVLALRMLLRAQDPLKRVHDKVRRPSTYRRTTTTISEMPKVNRSLCIGSPFGPQPPYVWCCLAYMYVILKWPSRWQHQKQRLYSKAATTLLRILSFGGAITPTPFTVALRNPRVVASHQPPAAAPIWPNRSPKKSQSLS